MEQKWSSGSPGASLLSPVLRVGRPTGLWGCTGDICGILLPICDVTNCLLARVRNVCSASSSVAIDRLALTSNVVDIGAGEISACDQSGGASPRCLGSQPSESEGQGMRFGNHPLCCGCRLMSVAHDSLFIYRVRSISSSARDGGFAEKGNLI